jgi:hypothetical protein
MVRIFGNYFVKNPNMMKKGHDAGFNPTPSVGGTYFDPSLSFARSHWGRALSKNPRKGLNDGASGEIPVVEYRP